METRLRRRISFDLCNSNWWKPFAVISTVVGFSLFGVLVADNWSSTAWIGSAVLGFVFFGIYLYFRSLASLRLVMDEKLLTLTQNWLGSSVVPWASISAVQSSFEGGKPVAMTVIGSEGKDLLTVPLHMISQKKAHELLSLIAVRLPEGALVETKTSNLLTHSVQLIGGALCYLPLIFTLARVGGEGVDLFSLVWKLAFDLYIAGVGYRFMAPAFSRWQHMRNYEPRPDYRTNLFPYVSWWFIGAPIPGARAFQYREEITRAEINKAVWRQRITLYLIMTLPLVIFLPLFEVPNPLNLLPLALVLLPAPLVLILFRRRTLKRTQLLATGLSDEILLDETGISVWREGELSPADILELPEIASEKGPLLPSLTLRVSGKLVEFDSTAMQVVEIS